jgi:NtrC-family two-component system sensor histidine kinase KinB
MNLAAVRTLAAAGVQSPRSVYDLRVEGLDLNAVTRAIATGSELPPPTDLTQTIRVAQDDTVQRLFPRVVPVAAFDAQRQGAILLLYDVTELVRLDEMRSEVVAVASHELQTPLTTLRMTLLMLQEASDALPDRQRQLVATSLIGVEQLTETVHEFLDLTRIEAGELRLNLEPLHISSVIASAVRRVEGQAIAQGIALSNLADRDLPPIVADSLRLRAVFDNIFSNALKYTPSGGSVSIQTGLLPAVGDQPDTVSISITDTGPGIPSGFRSRIFDKFFRLEHHHSEARSGARGAGIGLYMCRQIVELHGGDIACDSGAGGGGTRITVRLPATLRSDAAVADATVLVGH